MIIANLPYVKTLKLEARAWEDCLIMKVGFSLQTCTQALQNQITITYVLTFSAAEIDGELFPTLTREEFSDMFKNLRQKRAAIAVWSKLSAMARP